MVCSFFSAGFPHTTECDWEVGWNHCVGGGRAVGLYHRADCVECGIESDRFSLGGLHVGVIHWVLERRLAVGALMANVAIELDLRTCPGKENGRDKMLFTPDHKDEETRHKKKMQSTKGQVNHQLLDILNIHLVLFYYRG